MSNEKRPNVHQFKSWCKAHRSLAEAVCLATAFAQAQRVRVDAYIQPLFDSFGFLDEEGAKIDKAGNLYLCTDEATCTAFYAAADAAHRAHGFTGPQGHCPALVAEHLQIQAEYQLIEAGCELFGLNAAYVCGENRAKLLQLLLKSCIAGEDR